MNLRLYLWQRGTAVLIVPLLLVHLAVIFYASRKGLSAADILSRTRGSVAWGAFYGVLVAAISIHAAIGVRTVLAEWTALPVRAVNPIVILFGLMLAVLGFRAVLAVVMP